MARMTRARSTREHGVRIHAASGYLIDQFMRNNADFREDA
jgi:2,4-dienoyl-CoA reductase-like NADH-dependent reductase (Old Yellow Enzyme family)